mgnify:CR=1 FL=1
MPKDNQAESQLVMSIETNNFTEITRIESYVKNNDYLGEFIVATPDHKRFSEFNTFFQLGVLAAKSQLNIKNEVKFINQDNLNISEIAGKFLIGPLSAELVNRIDGRMPLNNALLLNDTTKNYSISLSQKSQIHALESYLSGNGVERLGFIESANAPKEQIKEFKEKWFKDNRDTVTIQVNNQSSLSIENFLNVADSKIRFDLIDNASFSEVKFVPRARRDFKQIVIFTNDISELYELASLVRFNYGLNYEIFSLTSHFNSKIEENEISLHEIKLVDHTYENKFSYDLPKSRSFSLGFDAMLISFAIANNIVGEIRGLLGIYEISRNQIIQKSYIN